MTINYPAAVREPQAEWVHRLSLRLLLFASVLLVVGVGFLLWDGWELSLGDPGFDPGAQEPRALTVAERALKMTFTSQLGPQLLLLAMLLLCSALVVVRRPWDTSMHPPTRGMGLQPEIIGVAAAGSLLAFLHLMSAVLGMTATGLYADLGVMGALVTGVVTDIATLCLAAILTAHWWASAGLRSTTTLLPLYTGSIPETDGPPATIDGLQTGNRTP
jgi:hypothetical protein